MCEMGQIGEMVDLVVRNVEDSELGVGVEARYCGQGVVGYIELLEVKKRIETTYGREAVGLNGQQSQICQR